MRTVLRVFGECCVTAGAVVVLFLAYLLWGTAWQATQDQHAYAAELQREWRALVGWDRRPGDWTLAAPKIHLVVVKPFAFIRIPRFGPRWRFAIVEGTGLAQLATGPGHVTGTALPGQIGNFAVAAHRVTAGNPFYHLGDLRPGNTVLIDTAAITYTYRVTTTERVLPWDTAVLDPVPRAPAAVPPPGGDHLDHLRSAVDRHPPHHRARHPERRNPPHQTPPLTGLEAAYVPMAVAAPARRPGRQGGLHHHACRGRGGVAVAGRVPVADPPAAAGPGDARLIPAQL
jgi:sortase A